MHLNKRHLYPNSILLVTRMQFDLFVEKIYDNEIMRFLCVRLWFLPNLLAAKFTCILFIQLIMDNLKKNHISSR